jgi:ABC-type dipeptide/oligopeptide/nickel transport system permease subunit
LPRRAALILAIAILVVVGCAGLVAEVVAPYPYTQQNVANARRPPSAAHWLGTDELGRDILSRVIVGARVSLGVAIVAQMLILMVGVPLGGAAGYFGGWVDNVIARTIDVLFSFPDLLLIIVVVTSIRAGLPGFAEVARFDAAIGGLLGVFLSLAIVSWLSVARLVRAQVASLREREFIEAARASGATDARILARHLWPNVMPIVVVAATLGIPRVIIVEASLSFIGLGVQPPFPSWGAMILNGANAVRAGYPHLLLAPAGALTLTVLACTIVGDWLGQRSVSARRRPR